MNMLDHQFTISRDGLSASIDLCSYIYPYYGLQISIVLDSTGQKITRRLEKPFSVCTEQDFLDLFYSSLPLDTCSCGNPCFRSDISGNHKNLCRKCFLDALNAEIEKDRIRMEKEQAEKDASMLAEGFTHRVVAWIHPILSIGDYSIAMYFKESPSKEKIHGVLKRHGSSILNDYTVHCLC